MVGRGPARRTRPGVAGALNGRGTILHCERVRVGGEVRDGSAILGPGVLPRPRHESSHQNKTQTGTGLRVAQCKLTPVFTIQALEHCSQPKQLR